ncbi:jg22733 [Pararge aegeria aegeria]|uniref:Jg22733 protein n=1 Tax=Pararge aegeria aegeria TaxID=348720 RepID=A0A8S4QUJ9_9NEOP|nr:jg22733 [Pararge aegeria aegeria]
MGISISELARLRGCEVRRDVFAVLDTMYCLVCNLYVDGKNTVTKLSDIFRLMADLQINCDIEDYTVNQSSLDQMFLNFTERTSILDPTDDLQMTPRLTRRPSDELDSITSL